MKLKSFKKPTQLIQDANKLFYEFEVKVRFGGEIARWFHHYFLPKMATKLDNKELKKHIEEEKGHWSFIEHDWNKFLGMDINKESAPEMVEIIDRHLNWLLSDKALSNTQNCLVIMQAVEDATEMGFPALYSPEMQYFGDVHIEAEHNHSGGLEELDIPYSDSLFLLYRKVWDAFFNILLDLSKMGIN